MSDEVDYSISIPLSRDVDATIEIRGEPDDECFDRLQDGLTNFRRALLGKSQPVILPKKEGKAPSGKKRPDPNGDFWVDRVCQLHPTAPRNAANGCVQCISERNTERHKDAFSATTGHVEVGCSKRHFERLIPGALGKEHERWALYTAEEIQKIKEYWLKNRSKYESQAAANLEEELDDLVEKAQ